MTKKQTKEETPQELATVEKTKDVSEVSSVDTFIQQAIGSNVSVETMEKLFALREKVKAEKAKEEYTQAMAYFQRDCPVIEKTKKVMNKDGISVRYMYAPLDVIVEKIKVPLSKNGLAYSFDVEQKDGMIKAIAIVTHIFGHSERTPFEIPIDKDGYMTEPQKYASALTFGKRYALCNALGILTGEEDTDATDVNREPEAKSPKAKIIFLLKTLGDDTKTKESIAEAVKKHTKLELSEKNYSEIVSRLEVLVTEQQEYEKSS